VRDITIWNRSEIPTSFYVTVTPQGTGSYNGGTVDISEAETGVDLKLSWHPIAGYYRVPIRINFKPKGAGEFKYLVKFHNLKDIQNNIPTVMVSSHVTLQSEPSESVRNKDSEFFLFHRYLLISATSFDWYDLVRIWRTTLYFNAFLPIS
jgi:hypothetical protein